MFSPARLNPHQDIYEASRRRNASVAYTRHVPPEIFHLVLSYLDHVDLIRATAVSTFWRTAALASPLLWRVIAFDITDSSYSSLARMFITRAQALPLDLHLHDVDVDKIPRFISATNSHIRLLAVSWSSHLPSAVCLQEYQHVASSLEYLDVAEISLPPLVPISYFKLSTLILRLQSDDISTLFSLCPNLVSLHLEILPVCQVPQLPIPLSLRHVVLHSSHLKDLSEYLYSLNSQSLSSLVFSFTQYLRLKQSDRLNSFAIEYLDLSGASKLDDPRFLQYKTSVVRYCDTVSRLDIATAVHDTSSTLRGLSFCMEIWTSIFRHRIEFPALETLTIVDVFSANEPYNRIVFLNAPHLHTVELVFTKLPDAHFNRNYLLIRWRDARRPNGHPIRIKKLIVRRTPSCPDWDRYHNDLRYIDWASIAHAVQFEM